MNGTGIPSVNFDVGESYAGLLPIGDENDTDQLYFWFFPSTNPAAQKEIMIWVTGGVSPRMLSSGCTVDNMDTSLDAPRRDS